MRSVPYGFVVGLAREFGAVEVFWRESDVSFTGFVAEVWFDALPREFALKWAVVVGYAVQPSSEKMINNNIYFEPNRFKRVPELFCKTHRKRRI